LKDKAIHGLERWRS